MFTCFCESEHEYSRGHAGERSADTLSLIMLYYLIHFSRVRYEFRESLLTEICLRD